MVEHCIQVICINEAWHSVIFFREKACQILLSWVGKNSPLHSHKNAIVTVVTQLNLYLSTIFFWGFFVYVGCPNEFWMGYRAMITHRMSEKLSLVKSVRFLARKFKFSRQPWHLKILKNSNSSEIEFLDRTCSNTL